ncbi:MAG: zinc ABC transporter substrate-binding protein [Candidatus Levybacteria bacterium]|nr:zinc ABC transporter substrate-binding protein [Candidatus Levybacteria bacterium]
MDNAGIADHNMKRLFIILATIIVFLGALFLISRQPQKELSNKLDVATSFYPVYFIASQIGGDKANVVNITPAGSEPHDYDPSPRDIATIEKGDMLILNGGVEPWADEVKENLKDTHVKIITAGEGLFLKELIEDGEKNQDPHIWLNPIDAKKEAKKILSGYISIDPTNKAYYEKNAQNLYSKLESLDSEFKNGLLICKNRNIITSHAAFAYLAERYSFQQIAIAGLSPDEEPSAQRLASVAAFAQAHSVRYIYFESLVSPKLSEAIAHEVGAKTLVLDPIEGISDDNLKKGADYFSVMKENLKNLQIGQECTQ